MLISASHNCLLSVVFNRSPASLTYSWSTYTHLSSWFSARLSLPYCKTLQRFLLDLPALTSSVPDLLLYPLSESTFHASALVTGPVFVTRLSLILRPPCLTCLLELTMYHLCPGCSTLLLIFDPAQHLKRTVNASLAQRSS